MLYKYFTNQKILTIGFLKQFYADYGGKYDPDSFCDIHRVACLHII